MDSVLGIRIDADASGDIRLDWREAYGDVAVDVHVGHGPNLTDTDAPVARAVHGGLLVAAPGPGRSYFRLVPAHGEALVVARRDVPLEGCVNFRDLGGYRTEDGRRVRWGRVFRSGHMANLTDAGKHDFAALDIRAICDFRMAEERAAEDAELPGAPVILTLGIPPGVGDREFFHRVFAATDDPLVVREAIHDTMRAIIGSAATRYARMFDVLLASRDGNALLNCSAGKERTGIGSALFLSALGVPRETIYFDFMLSRQYFPAATEVGRVRQKYAVRATDEALANALVMPLLETHASYLAAAFAVIDASHASTTDFLAQACGLGTAELRQLRDIYTC